MWKLVVLLASFIPLTPRPIRVPTVRKSSPPYYVVENPKNYEVDLTFNCGDDYSLVVVPIAARVMQVYEIRAQGDETAVCWLDSWEKHKAKK